MKAIRIVNHSEGLTFGRCSPADNPPLARVPAGGRWVTDHHMRRRVGLVAGDDMPDEIEIDGSEVEGLVVVGGYTQEAMAQAERLKASHPELRVHVFRNSLAGTGGKLVGD